MQAGVGLDQCVWPIIIAKPPFDLSTLLWSSRDCYDLSLGKQCGKPFNNATSDFSARPAHTNFHLN